MGPSAELETYRTLRLGMAAAGVLLFIALFGNIAASNWRIPGSVSATYYELIRTIFVGVLMVVGLALVTVKGRPGWENGLLDAAGVLIPLVALVPTPILDATCPSGQECIPPALVPSVEVDVGAYLWLGGIALGYLWFRRWYEGRNGKAWDSATAIGVAGVSVLFVLVAGIFLLARPFFLQFAHYGAAIPFFAILVVVVVINARHSAPLDPAINQPASWYRRWYAGIATAMGIFIVGAVVVFIWTRRQNAVLPTPTTEPFPVIFWVEVVLLLAFVLYWFLQTAELWNETVPGKRSNDPQA
ncbi:MAG TPA: hypothetical protein VK903_05255 [Propionicimonas sp.]|nr:hypothetical protein [Propionicimonas sp.]